MRLVDALYTLEARIHRVCFLGSEEETAQTAVSRVVKEAFDAASSSDGLEPIQELGSRLDAIWDQHFSSLDRWGQQGLVETAIRTFREQIGNSLSTMEPRKWWTSYTMENILGTLSRKFEDMKINPIDVVHACRDGNIGDGNIVISGPGRNDNPPMALLIRFWVVRDCLNKLCRSLIDGTISQADYASHMRTLWFYGGYAQTLSYSDQTSIIEDNKTGAKNGAITRGDHYATVAVDVSLATKSNIDFMLDEMGKVQQCSSKAERDELVRRL